MVLATPVFAMADSLEKVARHLEPRALVTDVGSVKGPLAETLPGLLERGAVYVGAHPMAGGHESGLLHADETTHKEHGQALWLWVFVSASTVLFYIGHRTKEMVENLLGEGYAGWLMSDGYKVYRAYRHRLRCWAHLQRKAKGLEESFDGAARGFGRETGRLSMGTRTRG